MRRKLTQALVRVARRAAIVSALGLVVALALGVGGYALATAEGRDGISIAAATSSPPRPEVTSLAAAPRRILADGAAAPAISVIPLPERAVALSVEPPAEKTTPLSASAALDLVVAAALPRLAQAASTPSTPALVPGDKVSAPVSFYYCTPGTTTAATGDGGGFCGAMRDGSVVYSGAAACDVVYLGQRFRIQGDPLQRIYKCADTGSAVHGLHRDIWFGSSDDGWKWQRSVGQAAAIEILP